MAVLAAIAFATLLLENDDFVTLYEGLGYFADYFCTDYGGSAYGDCAVIVDEKDTVKFYCVALLALFAQEVDIEETSGLCLELLALDFYDNVHC